MADRTDAAGRARGVEHLDRALLQDAGADGGLDLFARALVDDDGADAGDPEEVRQQQAGGSGADDGDAGADRGHDVSFDVPGRAGASAQCARGGSADAQIPVEREQERWPAMWGVLESVSPRFVSARSSLRSTTGTDPSLVERAVTHVGPAISLVERAVTPVRLAISLVERAERDET